MRPREQVRRLLLNGLARAIGTRGMPAMSGYDRVLVIRPDHLGDLVLSAPALQRLRSMLPDAQIALLVGSWNRELAEHMPYIDQVLTFPFPWFDRQPKKALWDPYVLLNQEAQRLRGDRWDLALVLRADFWWGAMLAARADIPHRVGYALPEVAPFLTNAVPYVPGRHEAEQNLALVEAVLPGGFEGSPAGSAPAFTLTTEEETFADRWLEQYGNPVLPVLIHPGAGAAVKHWRAERFSALADVLAAEHGATVVVTGSEGERGLVEEIVAHGHAGHLGLIGAGLGQLAAVLQRCALAIGVDSGIMHLAAALGVPTVRLYGPVDPARFGPWGSPERHRVVRAELPCVPCNRLDFSQAELSFHPCVRAITVDAALEVARPFLLPPSVAGQP